MKVVRWLPRSDFIFVAILLLCLVKTFTRNRDWKDDFTLFTTDVATSRDSIKGNLAAAVSFMEAAQKPDGSSLAGTFRARALDHAKRAVELYDRYVASGRPKGASYDHAIALLCDAYRANGSLTDALVCYRKVITTVADQDRVCQAVEAAISQSTDVDYQLRNFSDFAALVPDNFLFHYRLGYLYGKEKGDLAKSLHHLQRAVDLHPQETHALEALSHAYKLRGNYDQAALYLERAAALAPGNRSHLMRLLSIYQLAGNQEKAREVQLRLSPSP